MNLIVFSFCIRNS